MKRNLKADLGLCNEVGSHLENTLIEWDGKIVLNAGIPGENIHQLSQDQYMLIIRACEGWPYAIKQALAEKERADKYEALTQELVDVLDVVLSEDSIPMSEWLESKGQLKKIHSKAKEVLGDE